MLSYFLKLIAVAPQGCSTQDDLLHVLLSLFCRRFLLPEYLPYAGIFHERGQPGLATHSSVNRVLAGNEISLFAVVMYVSGVFS